MLHSRTFLFIHTIYKSLHLLTPNSCSISTLSTCSLATTSLFSMEKTKFFMFIYHLNHYGWLVDTKQ